ncbi:hypothetical protein [Glaciimonas soli]|uniref:Uncharacterized protein n=1 Tax=Glaciimonas soli TaxID=2590999 RepID=A0A843Z0Y3_9BURK|nr:hypothetical protein [Glaciimonas soli]MQR02516.1 hypothetical protein [Glaciimonas soli]
MDFRARKLAKVIFIVVAAAALGAAVMLLWNLVMPGLFVGSRQIDYWHAVGLLVLCRILFGGFRGHVGWHGRHQHWQKWQEMTPEEREQFRKHRPFPRRRGEERGEQ